MGQDHSGCLGFAAQIISAHLANNPLAPEALPVLIQSVYRSLVTVGEVEAKPEAQAPAVPVTKSVFPEFIVCLEDGKKLKALKRHLKTSYNMTPAEYRTKRGLPRDYPKVAPAYRASPDTGQEVRPGPGPQSGRGAGRARGENLLARRARGAKG